MVTLLGDRYKPNPRLICRPTAWIPRAGRIAQGTPSLDTGVNRAPCADTVGRRIAMLTALFTRIFAAGMALAVVVAPARAPAQAADDIEAKAQSCAVCHGQNGVPIDPKTIPIIWGQEPAYLFKQMRNYRNGEREHPIMSPIAKALPEADLRKLTAYF